MAGPEDSNGGKAGRSPSVHKPDTLNYLCDIIVELQSLADRSGQRTLSAILAAALTEARVQKEEGRRPS